MSKNIMHDAITLLAEGKNLTRDVATRTFQIIMNGGATPAQMAAFLMGLRIKGETIDEITAGAIVLRAKATPIKTPDGCIDTCGTGGDNKGTYNISTATAFVVAAAGVPVAKHGNRSVSSRSGSADVLEKLGIKIDAEVPVLERCFEQCNMAFLMAPRFHSAMRHVSHVRQDIGIRTIFNLLGPLANPATPDFQLLGVYSADWVEPLANVLKELGLKRAWVVHGHSGLDELSISGPSKVASLENGKITTFEVSPEEINIPITSLEELRGKTPTYNADALRHALSGMDSAYRNAVILNASAAILIAGKADTLQAAAEIAKEAIDSGKAHGILQKLITTSNEKV